VIDCFSNNDIKFFHINQDFTIDEDDLIRKVNSNIHTIFFAHYLGASQPQSILEKLRNYTNQRGILLIEDTTQSFFSIQNIIGDYAVASLRKWIPIPHGGVVYSHLPLLQETQYTKSTDNTRAYAMVLKDMYLRGNLDDKALYRKIFSECENRMDYQHDIHLMSDFAHFILSSISVTTVIQRRKRNYQYLLPRLIRLGIKPAIQLSEDDCPFVFPIRVPDRDVFREYLIRNHVYCAVHWPFEDFMATEKRAQAKLNAGDLISLPIDQRYDLDSLDYLVEVIAKYGGELTF
jgi:hypothetical protein